jgi:short-subunit dehydrogenase
MTTFSGARVLVTGASSGIGRAIARDLVDRGAHLWAVGRHRDLLESALAGCAAGAAETIEADLGADESLAGLCRLAASLPELDVLVHAAGVIHLAPFGRATAAQFDEQYRVNLRAPYLLTQAALPALRRRRGQVAFINSTATHYAGRDAAQYAATKSGLRAVADGLRGEVNAEGIRVLTVYVGRTATPMQAAVHAHEGRPWRPEALMQPADVSAAVIAALTLPSTAELYELSVRPMMGQAA